jgi:hypothetical protein
MVMAYWRRVATRAFTDTAALLGLGSRSQIAVKGILGLAAIAGLLLFGSSEAAKDQGVAVAFIIAAIIFLFPLVYAWQLVSAPAKLAEEAARETKKLQTDLKRQSDPIAHSLVAIASVKTDNSKAGYDYFIASLSLENKGPYPLRYDDFTVSISLDGSPAKTQRLEGRVVQRGTDAEYTFQIGPYTKRDGNLVCGFALQYGFVDSAPSRELTAILDVSFQPKGAITLSACHRKQYDERALS